ncbi:MAG: hypothetical protein IIY77_00725 [Lachnospiraceae bacterium]|nr:hypothetical protein [Lachnospiraceae bacterium]
MKDGLSSFLPGIPADAIPKCCFCASFWNAAFIGLRNAAFCRTPGCSFLPDFRMQFYAGFRDLSKNDNFLLKIIDKR